MSKEGNPIWSKYQEKKHWSDYETARERVCFIYGVDPKTTHIHHITSRNDGINNPLFEEYDINELSNLYPFTDDAEWAEYLHTTKQNHKDLHNRLGKMEYERRKKNGTLGW